MDGPPVKRRRLVRSRDRIKLKRKVLERVYFFQLPRSGMILGTYPCYFCKVEQEIGDLTVEHLIPLSRGGALKDIRNLDLACVQCNTAKGDMTVEEYAEKNGLLPEMFPRKGVKEEVCDEVA